MVKFWLQLWRSKGQGCQLQLKPDQKCQKKDRKLAKVAKSTKHIIFCQITNQFWFFFRILTRLCFYSNKRDQWSSFGCSPEDQKVKDVRNQILHYGVDQKYLFRLEDVTKKMNTPKVVRCLEEVAKLVSIQCRKYMCCKFWNTLTKSVL